VPERKVLVDRADGRRAFADGGRHPFGGTGPNVADREQPGMAGLVGEWSAAQRVPSGIELL
jgi:hypothetical protein